MILKQMRRNAICIQGERSSSLDLARGRLVILGMCFILAYSIVAVRAIDLGIVQGDIAHFADDDEEVSAYLQREAEVRRGNVYDRNGELLATTIKTASLYVDPSLILEPGKLVSSLLRVFPDLDYTDTLKGLQSERRFAWIKRGITPAQQQQVLALGEPGLGFEYEDTRIYPQGALAAHLVGYASRDSKGLSGVERSFDESLNAGDDLIMTLDLRLQHTLRRELSKAIADFDGIGGAGVILDARSGEILAGVSLPDFDLNKAGGAKPAEQFSRLTLGVYELGSMFKIFSTAALLETADVPMSYTFDARKPIKIGRFTINDYHAQKRVLTLPEVFMHSSNIGTAMMGQQIGTENLRGIYRDLGLLDPMNFEIKEIGKPGVPRPWRDINTLTASYGHGVSTTPLQLAAATGTVVNGGFYVRPHLVKPRSDEVVQSEIRILSQDTSDKMRALLRLVVTEGTGKNADVPGFYIGGKTGTAEKPGAKGGYDRDKLISSFVGVFPMDDPRYVVMVMVDEPKGNKKSYGYATAGWVAAPAVARVVTSMASILGMPADQYSEQDDISNDLMPYIHSKKKKRKQVVSYAH